MLKTDLYSTIKSEDSEALILISASQKNLLVICPIAIAYSMEQIVKSVCVCQCICLSVCPSASTLTVAFLDRFSPKLAQS